VFITAYKKRKGIKNAVIVLNFLPLRKKIYRGQKLHRPAKIKSGAIITLKGEGPFRKENSAGSEAATLKGINIAYKTPHPRDEIMKSRFTAFFSFLRNEKCFSPHLVIDITKKGTISMMDVAVSVMNVKNP
jgi:hypothetical protein